MVYLVQSVRQMEANREFRRVQMGTANQPYRKGAWALLGRSPKRGQIGGFHGFLAQEPRRSRLLAVRSRRVFAGLSTLRCRGLPFDAIRGAEGSGSAVLNRFLQRSGRFSFRKAG